MAEYIDREAALRITEETGALETQSRIKSLPAADVKPVVKAHWIWMGDTGDSRFMCSNCKGKENVPTVMGKPTVWEYCPNCGVKIEQEPIDPKSTFYDLLYEEGGANTT